MRHRFLPHTAGERQDCPLRVLAPHRGLESIGSVLRLCFPAILGSQEFLRGVDCLGLRSKSMVSAGSSGIALVAGFGSRFYGGPRCLSGFYLPSHRLTIRRNLDIFKVILCWPSSRCSFETSIGHRGPNLTIGLAIKVFVPIVAADPMATPIKFASAS